MFSAPWHMLRYAMHSIAWQYRDRVTLHVIEYFAKSLTVI